MHIKKQLMLVILLAVVFGICVRWVNLGQKVYWYDEVVPTLRVAGYGYYEVQQIAAQKGLMTAGELQHFQNFTEGRGWDKTLSALGKQFEHPPPYYIFQRFLAEIFGPSPATFRSPSVIFSLLTFPSIGWLCWELFANFTAAGIAMALFAVSPMHIAYAQEAKPYSFLAFTTILSSAVLLRAVQSRRIAMWGIYSISLTTAFYSSLLAALPTLAHCIWISTDNKARRQWSQFLWALSLATGLFMPWLYRVVMHWHIIQIATQWTSEPIALHKLLRAWHFNVTNSVLDLGLAVENSFASFLSMIVFSLLVLITINFVQNSDRRPVQFCCLLLLLPFGILALRDLVGNGRATLAARYYISSLTILLIIIAGWLQKLLTSYMLKKQFLGQFALITLIVMGMASSSLLVANETSRYKIDDKFIEIADVLEKAEKPLILVVTNDHGFPDSVTLSYLVASDTHFLFSESFRWKIIPKGYSDYFFFSSNSELSISASKHYDVRLLPIAGLKNNNLLRLDISSVGVSGKRTQKQSPTPAN